jgi:hypothetical protein
VSNDGRNTETILFQESSGAIRAVTASLNHNATTFESDMTVAATSNTNSKLGNLWAGNGTIFFWQDEQDNVATSGWDETMTGTFNMTLPYSAGSAS